MSSFFRINEIWVDVSGIKIFSWDFNTNDGGQTTAGRLKAAGVAPGTYPMRLFAKDVETCQGATGLPRFIQVVP